METTTTHLIEHELEPHETLLWSGQPHTGIIVRGVDAFLIPFSLLWCGFAVFWTILVTTNGILFFSLFGCFFVLVGLYFVFGRFLWDVAQRRKMCYGITNERIIIVSGLFQKHVKSLTLNTLSEVSVSEKANGQCTILLGPTTGQESLHRSMAWPGVPQGAPKLEAIEEVRRVYHILREAQRT